MRADRLLSLLMLLQSRGRMSARELAAELEVSERTIYRDVDALSAAGIPVYGEAGREGGYALLDRYRTSLTGLTEWEVRALFMLSIPEPLKDLGVSQALKAALLKLSAALPMERREDETQVRGRFYLDSTWWEREAGAVPHLQILNQAIWSDRILCATFRPVPGVQVTRNVEPYGLVAKAGVWYLVCGRAGRIRVFRVAALVDVMLLEKGFVRPANFDLAEFWKSWCVERSRRRVSYVVEVRVSHDFLPFLPRYFEGRIQEKIAQATPDEAGWVTLELSFESLEAARERLLSFGRAVEVLSPRALRISLADYAAQITALYSTKHYGRSRP